MAKTRNLLTQILIYFAISISFIACDDESEICINYDLKKVYALQNSIEDTETYEKLNNTYVDNNKARLDNAFDAASFHSNISKIGYLKDRIHFKLNFENSSNGFFQDGKDSISLKFNFKYLQDSVVVLNCDNNYEYKFFINDDCKLEHCVYLVTTFENFKIENFKVIYSTYCFDKTYMDVAKELLAQFGSNAPDTIGINKFTLKEN